jgi:hypothetical protein
VWAVFGTLLSASVPFSSDKIVKKPEYFATIGVFVGVQLWGFFGFLRRTVSPVSYTAIIVSAVLSMPVLIFGVITASDGHMKMILQSVPPTHEYRAIGTE